MTALKVAVDNTVPRPKAEIRSVSPTTAKGWLQKNKRNRPVVANVVRSYARDMAAGNWQLTGEAIKFDTDGNLADGQHRLSAVVESDTTVEMLVVRDILPDTQMVMDSGRKRTSADALTLAGQKNPFVLSASARFALREPGCGFVTAETRVPSPTNSEIADFIDGHPEFHDAANVAQHYYPQFDSPPSVLAVCWVRFTEVDAAACGLFFSAIANMATEGETDARSVLLRRLARVRRDNERLSQTAYLSLIFRAWNAWRSDSVISVLPAESRKGVVRVPEKLL